MTGEALATGTVTQTLEEQYQQGMRAEMLSAESFVGMALHDAASTLIERARAVGRNAAVIGAAVVGVTAFAGEGAVAEDASSASDAKIAAERAKYPDMFSAVAQKMQNTLFKTCNTDFYSTITVDTEKGPTEAHNLNANVKITKHAKPGTFRTINIYKKTNGKKLCAAELVTKNHTVYKKSTATITKFGSKIVDKVPAGDVSQNDIVSATLFFKNAKIGPNKK